MKGELDPMLVMYPSVRLVDGFDHTNTNAPDPIKNSTDKRGKSSTRMAKVF